MSLSKSSMFSKEEAERLVQNALSGISHTVPSDTAQEQQEQAVPFNVIDFQEEATRLVTDAKLEATKLIEQAQAEVQELTTTASKEGYKTGYEDGLREGEEAGEKQGNESARLEVFEACKPIVSILENIIDEVSANKERLLHEAGHDLLTLSVDIANRVTRSAVKLDNEIVLSAMRDAIALTADKTLMHIHINPNDEATIVEYISVLKQKFTDIKHIELIKDENIEQGGVIVKGALGSVDATIETQLNRIAMGVLGRDSVDVKLNGDTV